MYISWFLFSWELIWELEIIILFQLNYILNRYCFLESFQEEFITFITLKDESNFT
jgi:hypothetical protein